MRLEGRLEQWVVSIHDGAALCKHTFGGPLMKALATCPMPYAAIPRMPKLFSPWQDEVVTMQDAPPPLVRMRGQA